MPLIKLSEAANERVPTALSWITQLYEGYEDTPGESIGRGQPRPFSKRKFFAACLHILYDGRIVPSTRQIGEISETDSTVIRNWRNEKVFRERVNLISQDFASEFVKTIRSTFQNDQTKLYQELEFYHPYVRKVILEELLKQFHESINENQEDGELLLSKVLSQTTIEVSQIIYMNSADIDALRKSAMALNQWHLEQLQKAAKMDNTEKITHHHEELKTLSDHWLNNYLSCHEM